MLSSLLVGGDSDDDEGGVGVGGGGSGGAVVAAMYTCSVRLVHGITRWLLTKTVHAHVVSCAVR